MKLISAFFALTLLCLPSAFASANGPKTLACVAQTQDLSVTTKFQVTLSEVTNSETGLKHFAFRSPKAFETVDAKYSIGLSADQPLNDPQVPHRRIGIWATDLGENGRTVQTGGLLADPSSNEQDHASIAIMERARDRAFELLIRCFFK